MRRPRLAVFVASSTLAFAGAAAANDLASAWKAIESPTVLGELDPPAALTVGRAEIVPAAGARLFVLGAGAQPCGLLLTGQAELRYAIEDSFSVSVARHNVGRAQGLALTASEGRSRLTAKLQGVAVWGWDLEPDAASARPVTSAELPSWLRDILAKKLDGNPSRDLLRYAWNGHAGYRWAVLHAASDEFVLDVDPSPAARQETLARFWRIPSGAGSYSGRWVAEEIVAQPIGKPWWDGNDTSFASVDAELRLVAPGKRRLEVVSRTTVRALRPGVRLLTFELVDEVLDADAAVHENRVTRVTVDGQPAPYLHDLDTLLVLLPRALAERASAVVEVASEGDLLDRPSGDNYWRIGNAPWYPRPAADGVEWSSFRIVAETAKPFVPFLPGEVVRREATATGTLVETKLKGPMRSVFVLAGKYSTVTEEHEGDRIHVSTYASIKEDEARRLARIVFAVRECYESWFEVPYPFQDLQIVEVNQWGWGQAPPGFIFITKEAFMTPARAKMDQETQEMSEFMLRGINARVAHEVAHAWFPHVVKVVRPEENWLSESFSDYVSAVCLQRAMQDKKKADHYFDRQLADWKSHARELPEHTSVFLAPHLSNSGEDGRNYYLLLYGKGPLVLHALRSELIRDKGPEAGDQAFLGWMRSIVKSSTYQVGETRHAVALLGQITGKDWQPWFERYVYGTETPALD